MSLRTYLLEALNINEGGHAVECRPITQPEARSVYADVVDKLLPLLGLSVENIDYAPLGSWGKKEDEQTSGDIDVAINLETIATNAGVSMEGIYDYVKQVLEDNGIMFKYNKGLKVFSCQWGIPNTSDYAQVDLMPSVNIDYSKWAYYSPDFRKQESKYKGLYRNLLMACCIKRVNMKTLSTDENGEIIEFEQNIYRLEQGVVRARRTYVSKPGAKRRKQPKTLMEYDKLLSNVPDEIVKMTFGDRYDRDDVMTFEQVYDIFMDKDFVLKDMRSDIIKNFCQTLKGSSPVPSEVERDWPDEVEEARKK